MTFETTVEWLAAFGVWVIGTAAGIALGLGVCWIAAKLYEHWEHRRFIRSIK